MKVFSYEDPIAVLPLRGGSVEFRVRTLSAFRVNHSLHGLLLRL